MSDLRFLADLLEDEKTWEIVADAIMDSRNKAPRRSDDRDSGDLLNDVIATLRSAAA